jgi:HSP20 family protein
MTDLMKREERVTQPRELFEQLFDDWSRLLPLRRAWMPNADWMRDELIPVDEVQDGENLVVRAELPGIDPEKDVEITVSGGMLQIRAERREEQDLEDKEKGYRRRELRYGSFSRTLQLPPGVKESDVTASYKDGILEIRVPTKKGAATRVPIERGDSKS